MKCDDIQNSLTDYLTREMGPGPAGLVREHLRKCPECRRAAAELQATLALLTSASRRKPPAPAHLSESRRRRIVRAITHPVMDWIARRHIVVSVLVALVLLAAVILAIGHRRLWLDANEEAGIPIRVGRGAPPAERSPPPDSAPTPAN